MADGDRCAARPNVWRVALRARCPLCGRGPLFAGFLAIAPSCADCGADFSSADTGDGAPVVVALAVGLVVTVMALWLELRAHPPAWVHLALWIPVTTGLALALLRPAKALLFAAQRREGAREARFEDLVP